MREAPEFHEAAGRLQALVRDLGVTCSGLRWVSREDYYSLGPRTVIASPAAATSNESLAKSLYDQGVIAGLGVLMHAAFTDGESVYCHVWYPADPTEAECAMMPADGGLKLSVADPIADARFVHSLSWLIRRTLFRAHRSQVAR